MRVGGLVWFIAGFVFSEIVRRNGLGGLFRGLATVVGSIVTLFIELPFVFGVAGVLAVIGFTLFIGREWSERARGAYEADNAWRNRTRHRD